MTTSGPTLSFNVWCLVSGVWFSVVSLAPRSKIAPALPGFHFFCKAIKQTNKQTNKQTRLSSFSCCFFLFVYELIIKDGSKMDQEQIKIIDPWLEIIGLAHTSKELNAFVQSKGIRLEQSQVKKLSTSTTYYNLHNQGIAFCFINDILDSIDFYSKDSKICPVDENILPFDVNKSNTAKDLVTKFGEPLEKGGGVNCKMDIWMRWERLQVEIDDRSWETAKDSRWKSITIF